MNKPLSTCPVCGTKLMITEYTCPQCGTVIKGKFETNRLFRLTSNQLDFAVVFIKNRGNITEVGKELGISYPTVRNKLSEVIKQLGFKVEEETISKEERLNILKKLEAGELSVQEAIKQMREEK
ncbi:MAG: hypothetical protein DRP50_04940 [Thermotoga sp.]|nr:DUF2089 domain-containing protein [Thermotogota bacterium]RKX54050.1 MAG: hypothetical protein DRP50_04940 [Thermotoga sp.]